MNLKKSQIIIPFSLLLSLILALRPMEASANIPAFEKSAENIIYTSRLYNDIAYLCDSICDGRASGSLGGIMVSHWAKQNFEKWKLTPIGENYYQCCRSTDSTLIHNVCAVLSSNRNPQKKCQYIVVCAHMDGIGRINDQLYPGADSNASGCVATINLAKMFSGIKMLGVGPTQRLMFVLFDGKEKGSRGAEEWVRRLKAGELIDPVSGAPIQEKDIKMLVNIDQIGATYSPVHKDKKEYLMMLGNERLPQSMQSVAKKIAREESCHLDLTYDYYGSSNFTRIFYRLADREFLSSCSFPMVFFTSGITFHNNKPSDTAESLDYEVYRKRILFIFHWLCRFAY